ncbi:MAG: GNAT family N-acetyltransferase, partial [Mycobacterium sp.]
MTQRLHRHWGKDLDAATLYELLKLRVEVFVVEQSCPYPELDGRDLQSQTRHFWLESPGGEAISTLRLMEENPQGRTQFRIGRVCT